MRTKQTLMTMVCCFILFSCKKDKDNSPACGISMDGIAGSYKVTKIQYKAPDSEDVLDFMEFMDECQKDDITTLYSNGKYKHDDGGLVCEPDETDEGFWVLKDQTILSDGRINGTIENYNCKTLVYYMKDVLVDGDKMTFTAERQ